MLYQHFLNLTRIHVETAANNHIFCSIYNKIIAVVVAVADVARVQPTIDNAFSGRFGAFVIAFHDVVTTIADFAFLIFAQLIAVFVLYRDFDTPNRRTNRTCFARFMRLVESDNRRTFRHTIAFKNGHFKFGFKIVQHLNG